MFENSITSVRQQVFPMPIALKRIGSVGHGSIADYISFLCIHFVLLHKALKHSFTGVFLQEVLTLCKATYNNP